jgi:hypothetical protein
LDATSTLPAPFNVFSGPSVFFQNNNQAVSGSWSGWDVTPGIDSSYSVNNQISFTIDSIPVIRIDRTGFSSGKYTTDATSLTLFWVDGVTPHSFNLPYGSLLVKDVTNAINDLSGFAATGNPVYANDYAASFRLVNLGIINTTAYLYRGLRDCYVNYQTISERLITPRIPQSVDRSSALTARINYLDQTRETQIKNDVVNEQILRTPTGDPSDLYIWANNRFNRRQGSYARLNQIQQQIQSNQSALNINKSFLDN